MSQEALLPVRHPNNDFFIADIFDSLPVKDDRHTMEHPFFTLSTKKDIRSVEYERDGVKICLSPSAKYGLPTMMDKDILLYVGSLFMAEINKGNIPPKMVRFSAHDLLVTTNRMTNGQAYKQLKNAFERITGCTISTNIETNGREEYNVFHILESIRIVTESRVSRRMVQVEATLSDWFYNALVGREVLTINRDYFRLRKTLERRLYELARKHCGKQKQWVVSLETLKDKTGALSPLRYFRYQIRQIIETDAGENHFPDYRLELDDRDNVTFLNRRKEVMDMAMPDDLPAISDKAIRTGAKLVADAGTGWDYRAIREQFTHHLIEDGFRPDNVDAAFIGFVKNKIKRRA